MDINFFLSWKFSSSLNFENTLNSVKIEFLVTGLLAFYQVYVRSSFRNVSNERIGKHLLIIIGTLNINR